MQQFSLSPSYTTTAKLRRRRHRQAAPPPPPPPPTMCIYKEEFKHGLPSWYMAAPATDLNQNTDWFTYPGVWTTYFLILFFSWLVMFSVFGCSPSMAWTIVHLSHFAVTHHFCHWKKGTPFVDDQGIYNRLTWWEQIDSGKQLTRNIKFLNVTTVVLYLIASHTTNCH